MPRYPRADAVVAPLPIRALAILWIAALPVNASAQPAYGQSADRALQARARSEITYPLWLRDGTLSPQGRALVSILRRVGDYGLPGDDFAPLLARIETSTVMPDAALIEESLTLAALRLMRYLHDGRVDPGAAAYELRHRRPPIDYVSMLRSLATSADVGATLAALEPRSSQYRALKQWLVRYRSIPDTFAPWREPGVRAVHVGDSYEGAGELRRRLALLGDALDAAEASGPPRDVYDVALSEAVARFQQRHGLQPDGVLGPRTLAALEVPLARRIRQIELTLERWRWLPDIQAPAVIVNVPQYMLYTLPDPLPGDAPVPAQKIPVIVGGIDRQTPIFDSAIEAVVIRPYWEVPRSIALEELLPLIERDPGYLARHDMEIVRGRGDEVRVLPVGDAAIGALRAGSARLRQRPGPRNALGLIKFVLPNRHDVYLHSTPEARLFEHERRALSHGCIRVSDASGLAAYLLKRTPGDWSVEAIEAATCADATFTVRLASPVPVFILYGTAVVDAGRVQFFEDVYGHDRGLEELLSGASPASAHRSARSE
jgi:murein L,D-transpeptidase YcbB/YkuD